MKKFLVNVLCGVALVATTFAQNGQQVYACKVMDSQGNEQYICYVRTSYDPNEMSGPAGVGEQRYVKPGESMDYTIYFENQTNATAAAIKIAVTLPKDENLDWSTLELGEVVFGDHTDDGFVKDKTARSIAYPLAGTGCEVRTTVTEDDDSVTWNLRIWDPNTTDHFPDDFNMGILPPNDPETHCGEGHITYRVKVKDDAAQGAVIRASASIVFDDNPAIETDPAWWNTVGSPGAQFAADEVLVAEGGTAEVRVSGGNADKASSVQVYLTYNTAAAADIDLAKGAIDEETPKGGLKFPLTLTWEAGEIGEKVITIPVKTDKTVEDDEFFTLQLANAQGMELGEERVCTVTIHDPGYDELAAKIADGTATKAEKTAWEKLQKAKAPYVRGLADPADGGKIAGSGLCAAGKKVTLKATANKNFTFMGWVAASTGETPVVPVAGSSTGETPVVPVAGSSTGETPVVPVIATTASLVIDRTAKPAANSKTSTTITNIAEDVTYYAVFKSYPEVFVTVEATDGKGAEPTGKGAGKYVAGTITGMGKYAVGKKVTLKVTANKGYVFAGWNSSTSETPVVPVNGQDARSPSVSFAMPSNDVALVAKFVTAEEDKANITLKVNGVGIEAAVSSKPPYQTNVWAGVYLEWPVAAEALSATTVKVAGLPSGLKFTAKPVTSKVGTGKSAVVVTNVPANTIYGVPTAASKADKNGNVKPSEVKVTVTTAGKSSQAYQIDTVVDALPSWAQGSFAGGVGNGELGTGNGESASAEASAAALALADKSADKQGTVSLTVSAAGKVSGKAQGDGVAYTLAAPYYSGFEALPGDEGLVSNFLADVTASWSYKEGSKAIKTNDVVRMAVQDNGIGGRASAADWFYAYTVNWKVEPWTMLGKKFDKTTQAYAILANGDVSDAEEDATAALGEDVVGRVTLKFSANGTVTVAGEFVTGYNERTKNYTTVKASGSATLVPVDDKHGVVFVYLTPKGLSPHACSLEVSWPEP